MRFSFFLVLRRRSIARALTDARLDEQFHTQQATRARTKIEEMSARLRIVDAKLAARQPAVKVRARVA